MAVAERRRRVPDTAEEAEAMLRGITCPVLVIHGTEDRCQPRGRFDTRRPELTGAERLVLEGSGHLPMGRDPVVVNRAIKDFVDRVTGAARAPRRRWSRGPRRRAARALPRPRRSGSGTCAATWPSPTRCASSARTSRSSGSPSRRSPSSSSSAGETVHPASGFLASESAHFESESGEHDLHAFQAIRRMDEILVTNFMVFDDLVEREHFDLWVGDEAWDLDHFLHENPELKRAPFVVDDRLRRLGADARRRRARGVPDRRLQRRDGRARRALPRRCATGRCSSATRPTWSTVPLGPGLPTAREWTEEHFDFAGYVMGERPATRRTAPALRRRLGYADGEVVCVVSVGGSGVGDAPAAAGASRRTPRRARRIPGLRMVVVAGSADRPGLAAARPDGVEVHGFLPDLDLHHAACDVAVVQGGLSTTMELTADGRPFLYFPLGHHFEQQVHVRHRLERHRAGRAMDYRDADPARIADALVEELGRPPVVPAGADRRGASGAAQLVAELI